MSGGSYGYIYNKLSEECEGRMYDAEMNDLIKDLCEVLHALEWWQSCDTSEEQYRKKVSAFKKKWFKGGRGMTDRGEVIATLTEHLDHWKRLLSEGVCTKEEGEKTINALTFAIDSIKVDRAYDLMYEKVDFIEIPKGATNGDMIKAMFPNAKIIINECLGVHGTVYFEYDKIITFYPLDWWNSPYRKEQE